MTPAVFLDRDGTLIEDAGYLDRLERLVIFPWSIDAVRLLNRAGYTVVVVTNQAGVARGIVNEAFIGEAHRYLSDRCAAGRATIDAYYYCPHLEDAPVEQYRRRCDCRKPRPGMLRQAAQDHALDLSRSWVIGDRWLDVELAANAGAGGILVRTGYGRTEEGRPPSGVRAEIVVDDLMAAVGWILRTCT